MIITLLEPQIPPNTGNIARLCAATNTRLEIVGNIGFDLTEKAVRRAGLDYWQYLDWEYFEDLDAYIETLNPQEIHLLSKKVTLPYSQRIFKPQDRLIFGSEITGISEIYLDRFVEQTCTIPMQNPNIRSLNLGNSVAIVLYEAQRQQNI